MQQTRKSVNEGFMSARSEFNRLAKGIIEIEKLVLAEFVPVEEKLIAMEKEEKARLIREARLEALPEKRERIITAGIEFTDEEILALEDAPFELEFAMRLQSKLEADRLAEQARIDAENAKLAEKALELQREKDKQDAIEQARKEERERAENALRLQKEQAEREKREAEEAKKQEALALAQAEEALAKSKKYQAFLTKNAYNEATDIIIDGNKLYRFVAEYK
jgi:hypothetical protein